MKKKFKGSWILFFLFAVPIVATSFQEEVQAVDNNVAVFSYNETTIHQEVSLDTSGKTEFTATVSAAETQYGPDRILVGIELYGPGGGGIYSHSTGWVTLSSGGYTDIILNVTSSGVGATGWAEVASARLVIGGDDGEFWAGNYGPRIESASLKIDGNELLSNTEFSSGSQSWTSSVGWQECSAGSGSSPCVSSAPAPTSIVVTSLADTLDSGTLRWAITQANATSGGIYDSITFSNGLSGTISLTSSLPAISQNLTITGTGQGSLIIDGNNSYRHFFVNQNVSLTISGMTLKRGPSSSGGIIYNNRGTISATNIRFTSMSGGSAVFNNNAGAVATYTNCTWDYLSIGIAGDYGSTPQLPSGTTTWSEYADSGFQNRTYVNNGTFNNNWAGVYNYRFTKIQNSTFSNNSYGAHVTGLNRTQIYSSTFDTNTVGIYHNAWIPTTFNMGTDNRLIDGNTFINNGTSIYLDDGWNNGFRNQSWATVKNNIWDNQGTWITYSEWNGSSNITLAAFPTDMNVTFTQLSNTVPTTTTTTTTTVPETTTTTEPEQETTTTTEPVDIPLPTETLPTENTTVSIPELDQTPVSTPEPENTTVTTPELDSTPVSTPETENTTVLIPELDSTPVSTPEIDTDPVAVFEPEDLPNETIPEVSIPVDTQTAADETVTDIFNNTDNPDELGAAVTDAISNADSAEEIAALVTSLFDGPMNSEEFTAVVDAVFTEDLSTEELSAALDAVFSEPLSDEKFTEVIDAVLDSPLTDEQFAEVVNILESDNISEDQVADAVDNILENGVTEDQATELATSEKVLESIDGDQASEIFAEIRVGELTQEEESALVEAATNAPEEIKNAFEETINVYADGLDDYVPVGSNVDVGTRRTLLAATTALASATAAIAASGGPRPSSGGGPSSSGPSSSGSGDGPTGGNNNAARKEEEEGSEDEGEDPEIEGPDGDEEEGNFTRNSIFKYTEGTMEKRFSPLGFIKKFAKETAALAFTISGTVIVFATLSGDTRKITVIATSIAFAVHYLNAMLQNDE